MTTHRPLRTLLASCCLIALPLAGCAQDDFDDSDVIAQELELDNGGLDFEDEAPLFGDAPLFDAAQLEEESVIVDAIGEDPDIVALGQHPDALRVHVALRWGQMPFNPDATEIRDWSGTLSVNRGAIIARRSIAFEPGTGDGVEPRTDPRSLSFTSTTLPANDGLRLTIIDPTPLAEEALTLDYSDANGSVYSVELRDLLGAPQTQDVGDDGNRIAAIAVAQPVDLCSFGFIGGRWHRVAPDRGRLLGQVRAADGELLGHMRGLYGQRANGNRVFFGKYINTDGEFRGLFAGRYLAGQFRGLWLTRDGEAGALGGAYRETIPGPEVGGHFRGRWAETRCNVDVGPGPDMPALPNP